MTAMNIDQQYKTMEFADFGDSRGGLVVVEGEQDIPFAIKRVFYIYGSDDKVNRGQHANRDSAFILINVAGKSKVMLDNGRETRIVELDHPRMGLYISRMLWKKMYDFSPDSVLLVLTNTHYDGSEYIRDYKEYVKELSADIVPDAE